MPFAFISYTEVDEPIARAVTQALLQAGHDAWFAPRELRAGDPILGRVTDEIERREAFVALLSASALKSDWVNAEIRAALGHQVSAQSPRIVPVYLDVDRLHPALKELTGLHLRRDAALVAEAVVAALAPGAGAGRAMSCEEFLDALVRVPGDTYRSLRTLFSAAARAASDPAVDERARRMISEDLDKARRADPLLSDDDVRRILEAFHGGEPLPAVSAPYVRELRRFARRADARLLQLAAFLVARRGKGITRDAVAFVVDGWLAREDAHLGEELRRWQAERIVDEALAAGLLSRSAEPLQRVDEVVQFLRDPSYEDGPMLASAGELATLYLRRLELLPT